MGYYVSIVEKETGRRIKEDKYGVGYSLLMFEEYKQEGKNVIFFSKGDAAKERIGHTLTYIENNIDATNESKLLYIKRELVALLNAINDNNNYECDCTEMMYSVDNPNFDPIYFVEEFQDKLDDAINGYSEFGLSDTNNYGKMLETYIDNLSKDIRAKIIWKMNDMFVAVGVSVELNGYDETVINQSRITMENNEFRKRYEERKLFYILKTSGLKFEILRRCEKSFYVIISNESLEEWVASRPYIPCSYRYYSTYNIHNLVRNTPEQKERFYCYAKSQEKMVSIVIDGQELIDAEEDVVSEVIGKELQQKYYQAQDVDMIHI